MGSTGEGLGSGLGSGQGAGTEFFGIRARGRRFAYVVDISGSMGNDGRLTTAMNELGRSLSALPDFAEFKVTLYSGGVQFPEFQEGWLRANSGQVSRVRACAAESAERLLISYIALGLMVWTPAGGADFV